MAASQFLLRIRRHRHPSADSQKIAEGQGAELVRPLYLLATPCSSLKLATKRGLWNAQAPVLSGKDFRARQDLMNSSPPRKFIAVQIDELSGVQSIGLTSAARGMVQKPTEAHKKRNVRCDPEPGAED